MYSCIVTYVDMHLTCCFLHIPGSTLAAEQHSCYYKLVHQISPSCISLSQCSCKYNVLYLYLIRMSRSSEPGNGSMGCEIPYYPSTRLLTHITYQISFLLKVKHNAIRAKKYVNRIMEHRPSVHKVFDRKLDEYVALYCHSQLIWSLSIKT